MIEIILADNLSKAVQTLYNQHPEGDFQIQKTRKEFEGDLTIAVFPLIKYSRKSPEQTAEDIGNYLLKNIPYIAKFNIIKGFLNIVIKDNYWLNFLITEISKKDFGVNYNNQGAKWIIEYSSPNTNKPLHLGHIRNNILGWSIAKILEANGKNVIKVNLINDRGIHICKTMLAWLKWGNNITPESAGIKGDHLIGKFYVHFDKELKKEIEVIKNTGISDEEALSQAPLMIEAQEMLRKWEAGDKDIISLWEKMNSWVYAGFEETYNKMGISFDRTYYESQTYLLGKEITEEGLRKNILFKKEDGSLWVDLTDEGLDEKLLLRSDGTSVYITQDLGTAKSRYDDYSPEKLIYVVGNEQNYHFQVLKKILNKLGYEWHSRIHHLSYGMVELPEGKMKSREGNVVDADELMDEMYETAKKTTNELGKTDDFSKEEANELFNTISLGALKYFILKVDPGKNMLFNPKDSIDFDGNTGPFIQYTHARICSLLRKAGKYIQLSNNNINFNLLDEEKRILMLCHDFPKIVKEAGAELSPAIIANYIYELTKTYNSFYQKIPVLKEPNEQIKAFRLTLSANTGKIIKSGMNLLGIDVPERM